MQDKSLGFNMTSLNVFIPCSYNMCHSDIMFLLHAISIHCCICDTINYKELGRASISRLA